MKTLEELEKEGWKVTKTTIIGYEEGYDENGEKVTYIVNSDGTRDIKTRGWESKTINPTPATYHVPYDPSQEHVANKGKFWFRNY